MKYVVKTENLAVMSNDIMEDVRYFATDDICEALNEAVSRIELAKSFEVIQYKISIRIFDSWTVLYASDGYAFEMEERFKVLDYEER